MHDLLVWVCTHLMSNQSYTSQVHLKKGAHENHLGRQKMGWFLADKPVHQVKLKY